MAMLYYYAPALVQPEGEPHEGSVFPAKDEGSGPESAVSELPAGLNVLTHDEDLDRFVMSQPASISVSLPGWEMKTATEVNTDYPGLIP